MDMPVAPVDSYATRSGDPSTDKATVLQVWRGNLGDAARMAAKYAWFYEHAPAGAPLLQLLAHGCGTVGTGAIGRRAFLCEGAPMRAGVLVDLAVSPEHRSLGPAMILQQGLLANARTRLDLLYGFPNPKAAPVFKRMGYTRLGDMVRHVRVLRHRHYLQRTLPAWLAAPLGKLADAGVAARDLARQWRPAQARATWRDRVDPRMDHLWRASTAAPEPAAAAIRDGAYLRWRFDEAPAGGHRYLLLDDPRSAQLQAWFAVKSDQGTLHVLDFWSLSGPYLAPRAVARLLAAARKAGFDAVSIELASTHPACARPWQQLGFRERGKRPIFGLLIGDRAQRAANRLHLTSGDEDET